MECKLCGDEVDELFPVKVEGKRKKACEDCVLRIEEEGAEEGEIAEAAESAMQGMMEYKGRR